jgi:hypothetical protein
MTDAPSVGFWPDKTEEVLWGGETLESLLQVIRKGVRFVVWTRFACHCVPCGADTRSQRLYRQQILDRIQPATTLLSRSSVSGQSQCAIYVRPEK